MGFKDNVSKAKVYLGRNGLKKTVFASMERINTHSDYVFTPVTEVELSLQKTNKFDFAPLISILVPCFNTNKVFFCEMIDSVVSQSYGNWELIISDASDTDELKGEVDKYSDDRIRYYYSSEPLGISDNTNVALDKANGEYISLLDHDDVLTPDALYEVVKAMNENRQSGTYPAMVYTDEDKVNETLETFYEPNFKKKFNLDLILTNNYICHLLTVKTSIARMVRFRSEYDGAQDYDFILRSIIRIYNPKDIIHVAKVLYHWRCHETSTAANPESKLYAYEAGKRALQSALWEMGYNARAVDSDHVGFYNVIYSPDIFDARSEVGAIVVPKFKGGKLKNGAMDKFGKTMYEGILKYYSGYLHRAKLIQKVYCGDIECLRVRDSLKELHGEYLERLKDGEDRTRLSLEFAEKVHKKGFIFVYDPENVTCDNKEGDHGQS